VTDFDYRSSTDVLLYLCAVLADISNTAEHSDSRTYTSYSKHVNQHMTGNTDGYSMFLSNGRVLINSFLHLITQKLISSMSFIFLLWPNSYSWSMTCFTQNMSKTVEIKIRKVPIRSNGPKWPNFLPKAEGLAALNVGSSCGCQSFWQSIQGFRFYRGQILTLPPDLRCCYNMVQHDCTCLWKTTKFSRLTYHTDPFFCDQCRYRHLVNTCSESVLLIPPFCYTLVDSHPPPMYIICRLRVFPQTVNN